MIIGIVGSRKMSSYGKRVIELLTKELKGKCKMATIDTSGCNRELIRQGVDKVFRGNDFEKLNIDLANYIDKLIVIEGGENSGTLLVAWSVLEMGKEVWAIPGRITDEGSWAPNWLIQNGARLLLSVNDLGTGS